MVASEGDLFVPGERNLGSNALQNAIKILKNFIVPEPDDAIAMRFDKLGSHDIARAARVLPAVQFDHQLELATGKVSNKITNRKLPGKLDAHLPCAKMRPQAAFSISHVAAQFVRGAGQFLFSQSRTPTPNPLPQGRGLSIAKPS